MTVEHEPRPGTWGKDARPGELIRIDADGTRVYNVGAQFIPLWGVNRKKRRRYGLE